ncbi:MAG: hypothetical protein L0Y54_13190, partial [Sporichthyaceae bacterium]|nr:hypothetical protein [Sporichthyaceae bacterium]
MRRLVPALIAALIWTLILALTPTAEAGKRPPKPGNVPSTPTIELFDPSPWQVTRFAGNPLIPETVADNINGPSPIRVPECLDAGPLADWEYALYFADHHGQFVKVSVADSPDGPWSAPIATLTLDQVIEQADKRSSPGGTGGDDKHIGSPDVHVLPDCTLRMYFHANPKDAWVKWGHESGVAGSTDGVSWTLLVGKPILDTYTRAWQRDGDWYVVDRQSRLLRSADGLTGWSKQSTKAFLGQT